MRKRSNLKMEQIIIKIPGELNENYTELAKEYGWSRNDMFLWCLEQMKEEVEEWDKQEKERRDLNA